MNATCTDYKKTLIVPNIGAVNGAIGENLCVGLVVERDCYFQSDDSLSSGSSISDFIKRPVKVVEIADKFIEQQLKSSYVSIYFEYDLDTCKAYISNCTEIGGTKCEFSLCRFILHAHTDRKLQEDIYRKILKFAQAKKVKSIYVADQLQVSKIILRTSKS